MKSEKVHADCNLCGLNSECFKFKYSGCYYSDYLCDMTTYSFHICNECIHLWSKDHMHTDWCENDIEEPKVEYDSKEKCVCGRRVYQASLIWWKNKYICEKCIRLGWESFKIPTTVNDYYREDFSYAQDLETKMRTHFSWDTEAVWDRALNRMCNMSVFCKKLAVKARIDNGMFHGCVSCEDHLSNHMRVNNDVWIDLDKLPPIRDLFHHNECVENDKIIDYMFRLWWKETIPDLNQFWYIQWVPSGTLKKLEKEFGEKPFGMFTPVRDDEINYASGVYIPNQADPAVTQKIRTALRNDYVSQIKELELDDGTLICIPSAGTAMVELCREKIVLIHPIGLDVCGYGNEFKFDSILYVDQKAHEAKMAAFFESCRKCDELTPEQETTIPCHQ